MERHCRGLTPKAAARVGIDLGHKFLQRAHLWQWLVRITAAQVSDAINQANGHLTSGSAVLRKQLRRDQITAFFANLEPCLIGMEACGSAHHWARQLQALGHTI